MPVDLKARTAWARRFVADSTGENDPRDVLSGWERETFFGSNSVQLRIPLRDPVEVRRHLTLIEDTVHALRLRIEQTPGDDRTDLLTVRGVVKVLNHKLNAFRAPRRG